MDLRNISKVPLPRDEVKLLRIILGTMARMCGGQVVIPAAELAKPFRGEALEILEGEDGSFMVKAGS